MNLESCPGQVDGGGYSNCKRGSEIDRIGEIQMQDVSHGDIECRIPVLSIHWLCYQSSRKKAPVLHPL